MYVLTKEELAALQSEAALTQMKARLKLELQKTVQMSGTSGPMPTLPPRYPHTTPTLMSEWELSEGAKHDQEQEYARTHPQSQPIVPPPQQRTRTVTQTTRTEEFAAPTLENPVAGGRYTTSGPYPLTQQFREYASGVLGQERFNQLQNPQAGGQVQQEGGPANVTPTWPTRQTAPQMYGASPVGTAEGQNAQAQNPQASVQPTPTGAVQNTANPSTYKDDSDEETLGTSGGRYDAQTEGRVNPMFGGTTGRMEETTDPKVQEAMRNYFEAFRRKKEEAKKIEAATPIPEPAEGASPDEVNVNPPSKIAATPGQSGSSGVYRLNAGHPDLEKSFTKMNRTLSTYCTVCGVSVDQEGGDEAHFKKSGHAHFRKI